MTQTEFIKLLENKVKGSRQSTLVAFGLDICRRLFSDYVLFSVNNSWGDVEQLKEAIEFCEINKSNLQVPANIQSYLDQTDLNMPDTNDFGDFDDSYALNASCAVYELLNYLLDKDTTHIFNISTYMTDTIDLKLSEADESSTNEELDNHPDIVSERRYQLEFINTLNK